jgi:SAM-dependent methyltransferase
VHDVSRCVLCGGERFSPYEAQMYALDDRLLDLLRCDACGFVFVSPRPTPERLRELYATAAYYETDYTLGVSGSSYFARREELLRYYDDVVAALEQRVPRGRIFEVGAAGGFFLAAAARRGWRASGVEISPFAAEYARREMKLDVQTGDVTEAVVEPGSQDVVYVDNILEHTIDPLDVLRRLLTLLRPGGLLVVIVPTYVNSIYFRVLKGLRSSRFGPALARGPLGSILKLRRQAPSPPYHIDEFSVATIRKALEASGYVVERLEHSVPIPDYLASGTGLAVALQRAAFASADRLMRAGLLPGGRVEVWGRRPAAG